VRTTVEKFSPGVADKLGCYVYRLIDPRNGMTFYVGRGQSDRVFSHANDVAVAATELEDDEVLKKTPERGVLHADQIERLYAAEEAVFSENVLIISINQTIDDRPIIDAVRYAWKISKARAEKAKYVLAVKRGIIVGTFIAERWLSATPENFPGFPESDPTRFGFIAREAPPEVQSRYLHRRVPAAEKGAANPIRYSAPAADKTPHVGSTQMAAATIVAERRVEHTR
jgi:hypothetical protein